MVSRSSIQVINEPRDFLVHELFFSTTNEKGIIDYGNEVFVRISDYQESEIVGAPHSIVRHPDMPRGVFHLFWEKLKAGESIGAYVKNLAHDGRYYWVFAVACPCANGYLSVRLKPTSGLLTTVEAIYRQMRKIENDPDRQNNLEITLGQSRAKLQELLTQHGFSSYEAFMRHAVSVEMASRQKMLLGMERNANRSGTVASNHVAADVMASYAELLETVKSTDARLQILFDRLEDFKGLNRSLLEYSGTMLGSATNIQLLATNATVAAARISGKAATLDVVAQSLGAASRETQLIIEDLTNKMGRLVDGVEQLIFEVASVKLQVEVTITFLEEILSGYYADSVSLRRSLRVLQHEIVKRARSVYEMLQSTQRAFRSLEQVTLELSRNNQTLRFIEVSGKKETATIDAANGFAFLLRDVEAEIDRSDADCKRVRESVNAGLDNIEAMHYRKAAALRDLQAIGNWTHNHERTPKANLTYPYARV